MSTADAGRDLSSGNNGDLTWDSLSEMNHTTVVEGCHCAICQGLRDAATGEKTGGGPGDANPEGNNIGELLTITTNADGSRSFSGNRNVDATLIGSKWGTTSLTYSFPTSGSNYNGSTPFTTGVDRYHVDLGLQQQAAAKAAFAQLAAATGLTFTEITETDTVHANIRISQTADAEVGSAYGGFPSDTQSAAGDIWFGRTSQPYYDLAVKGTWGYATMLHEIGHTMGLKHGHQDYTNSDLSFYFGTTPRFGSQSLTPDRDGQAWSLMTYTPAPFTNAGFAGEKINQPQTYMQYDLAALQYLYGANYTTNATDSVYTFSQTTGEMFINGVGQGEPSGNKIFLTIWDGGGNDTIDVSNYANGVTIDLRPGEFSTFDPSQLANNLAYQNLVNLAPGNIAMSLLYNNDGRSLIENAKGGAGNDVFVGNTANNVLDGGAGSDTVIFTGTTGVNVTLNDTGADVVVTHDGETDTLRSIENIQGTSGNDTLIGNSQNNTLSGGTGGADTLVGGAGDDRLIGGGFTVVNTAIITKAQSDDNLAIASAIDPQARNAYTLVPDGNITNSTTNPHATINATATGGGLEYYRIDAAAGSTATFDIDFSSVDTWLELVDSDGNILASNDDNAADAGSSTGNSFISFNFATAGTYYIRVGRWTQPADQQAQPLAAGTTYTLHVSLSSATVNTAPFATTNTSSATLDGGEGNDFLQGTIANDTISGGAGNDTASFATAFSNNATGVTVDLNVQGTAQNTGAAGTDTLTGIENLVGSRYNDTLVGDASANVMEGGLGNDTLIGGVGDDTASYAGAGAGVTVSLALQGSAQNTGAAGVDTLSGFQNLLGSAFNDTLTGDFAENVLTGGAGDDVLNPGVNTNGAVDLLDGGTGSDTASFAGFTAGVTAAINASGDSMAMANGVAVAALRSVENLRGGDGNDTLSGDGNANAIEGGLGDDTLDGGAGNDTVVFSGATGVTVNLGLTTAQSTGWGTDTITGFENVRTGSGADLVTGDANDNVFYDGGGADSYTGGDGSDTVDYTNIVAALSVNLNLSGAQAAATGGDILSGIENVTGSATSANLLQGGNTTANRLTGGSANDFIIGNGLGDTLIGGAGNDVIFGDYVNTFSTAAESADGADVIEGGAGNDSLVGGLGNDTLRGGDGDDVLVGGIANGTSFGLTAVYTNDGGQDTFDGGDGTDTAYAYYGDQTDGIAFDLGNLAGNSAITLGGVAAGSFTSVERVIFRGGSGNDVVRGGGTLDTLVGGAGDDTLDGWYGNDTLSGGLGNDTLIGGEGLDTATYVNATAGVTVDLRIQGVAQDTGGEGIDTLSGIEYLTGSGFGDTLRGSDDFNLLVDNAVAATTGNTQTDALYGYGGDDSILVTRATGTVATTVLMDGGDGNDIIQLLSGTAATTTTDPNGLSSGAAYVVPGTSGTRFLDTVTVNAGTGNDRVVLTGVDAAVIDLGTGNDLLSISTLGGAGFNDHDITTGTGQDTIQLSGNNVAATTTARANVVRDFTAGNGGDRFELRTALGNGFAATSWINTTNFLGLTSNTQDLFDSGHLRLVQSGSDLLLQVDRDGAASATNGFVTIALLAGAYTGGFTAFNFDGMIGALTLTGQGALDETLVGASKNDTLSGGDGNDTLVGLAGDDTLDGGNGNDLLLGGLGTNSLVGGAGIDTASYSFLPGGVTVSLAITGAQATGLSTDTLSGIENLIGGAFDDTLTGDAGANTLDGAAGNDTLDGGDGDDLLHGGIGDDTMIGGAGFDTAIYSDAASAVTVNLSLTGAQATGGAGSDTLLGIEGLIGSVYDDVLTGGAGANRIDGDAGNDLIAGGTGDDVLLGGTGSDTLYYGDLTNAVQIDLGGGTANAGAQGGVDQVIAFENAILGAGNDLFVGDGNANRVEGGAGDDQLFGNAGADLLYGGGGSDQLFGGADGDLLDGGLGADFLSGGTGDDIYVVDDAGDQVSEFGGGGTDTVRSSVSYVLGSGIENLTLTGTASIDATGNEADNIIIGNAGRNTLLGAGGNDTIATVVGLAAVKPDAGFDRVDGGSGSDTLLLGGFQSDYRLLTAGDRTYLVTARGATEVTGIELAAFNNTTAQAWSSVLSSTAAFDGLAYIASYSDLRATFGNNAAAGESHFLRFGFSEGRGVSFNALDYIASYSDLRAAFGTDTAAATLHYVYFGADQESRSVTFDGWSYLASYFDLIQTFGPNKDAAVSHFIRFGANEGRAITFDAQAYAAANPDLAAAFGNDAEALARHYVQFGYAEGRSLGTPAPAATPATGVAEASSHTGAETSVPSAAFVADSGDHAGLATHQDAVLFTGKVWGDMAETLHGNGHVFAIA